MSRDWWKPKPEAWDYKPSETNPVAVYGSGGIIRPREARWVATCMSPKCGKAHDWFEELGQAQVWLREHYLGHWRRDRNRRANRRRKEEGKRDYVTGA